MIKIKKFLSGLIITAIGVALLPVFSFATSYNTLIVDSANQKSGEETSLMIRIDTGKVMQPGDKIIIRLPDAFDFTSEFDFEANIHLRIFAESGLAYTVSTVAAATNVFLLETEDDPIEGYSAMVLTAPADTTLPTDEQELRLYIGPKATNLHGSWPGTTHDGGAVINPTVAETTSYLIGVEFEDINASANNLSEFVPVAVVTENEIAVSATVNESSYLMFELNGDNDTIEFGELDVTSVASDTVDFAVATNNLNGYLVYFEGSELTDGVNNITPAGEFAPEPANAEIVAGTEGWGLNFAENTINSNFGAGLPDGVTLINAQLATANRFMGINIPIPHDYPFITRTTPTAGDGDEFTMSAAMAVDEETEPGAYTATFKLSVVAPF